MNIGAYEASRTEASHLLKRHSLLKGAQTTKGLPVAELVRVMRRGSYLHAYQEAVAQFAYDLLLVDDSFFQFSYSTDSDGAVTLRYAFLQQPFDFPTYEGFLQEYGFEPSEVGDAFLGEFEQALTEADLNTGAVSLRYDYCESTYRPGCHSVSHLHVGWNNEIRVPVHCYATPVAFVLFALRHVYPRIWAGLLDQTDFAETVRQAKRLCPELESEHLTELDSTQLYLQ